MEYNGVTQDVSYYITDDDWIHFEMQVYKPGLFAHSDGRVDFWKIDVDQAFRISNDLTAVGERTERDWDEPPSDDWRPAEDFWTDYIWVYDDDEDGRPTQEVMSIWRDDSDCPPMDSEDSDSPRLCMNENSDEEDADPWTRTSEVTADSWKLTASRPLWDSRIELGEMHAFQSYLGMWRNDYDTEQYSEMMGVVFTRDSVNEDAVHWMDAGATYLIHASVAILAMTSLF